MNIAFRTVLSLVLSACFTAPALAAPTIQLLGIEGGPAPGFTGEWQSNGYRVPTLNNNGQVAVAGFAERDSLGGRENSQAVWIYNPDGSAQLVARGGDSVLGATNNTIFETMFSPAINERGELAWQATLLNPNDPTDISQSQALIQARPGGVPQVILQQGNTYNGPNGELSTVVELRGGSSINEVGTSAVLAIVDTTNYLYFGSVFLADATGATQLTIPGHPAPGFNDGTTSEGSGLVSLNDLNQTAFIHNLRNTTSGGRSAILGPTPTGLGPVAQIDTDAPGFPDGTFIQTFWSPVTNNAGQTAFLTRVRSGAGPSAQDTFVVYRSNGIELEPVAIQGHSLPGLAPGETLGVLQSTGVNINANGDVTFTAEILDSSGQPYPERTFGLFGPRNGQPSLLARDGQLAPGVDDGALLNITEGNSPIINANGDMLFLASLLVGSGPDATTDEALYFYDANTDELQLVLRSGDLINTSLDPLVHQEGIVKLIRVSSGQLGEGQGFSSFNDNGWIAAEITIGNSTSGLYLINPHGIPEPVLTLPLLVAFLLTSRYR